MKENMELIFTPGCIVESLQYMEDLIEGRFAKNDLSKARFAENRLSNLGIYLSHGSVRYDTRSGAGVCQGLVGTQEGQGLHR